MPVWRRVTTRPVTLAGVDLPEGARLYLWRDAPRLGIIREDTG